MTAVPALASHIHVKTQTLTPTISSYCTLYEQTLATKLNVSVSTLQSANVAALDAVINQAVKDEKITQAKATQIEQKLASDGSAICRHIGSLTNQSGAHAVLHQVRTDVMTAVATKLGYTDAKALHAALKGTDIVTLAKSKGFNQATLNATITTTVQTNLASLVTKGTITSA